MKLSNTELEVVKRLDYCYDLNDIMKSTMRTSRLERLIEVKRKTLESLILGKKVAIGDEFAASPSAVFKFIDDRLIGVDSLSNFDKSQLGYDLLGFLDISVLGQKQLSISGFDSDTVKKYNNLVMRLGDLRSNSDVGGLLEVVRGHSKLSNVLDGTFVEKIKTIDIEYKKIADEAKEMERLFAIDVSDKSVGADVLRQKFDDCHEKDSELSKRILGFIAEREQLCTDLHSKVVGILLENSLVDDSQAEKWFNNINLHSSAKKALKNVYVFDKFKELAIRTYKLTAGRIPSFELHIDGAEIDKSNNRAFAKDMLMHLKKTEVHLSSNIILLRPETVCHELTHLIEYQDYFLSSLGKGYIKSRSLDGGKHHKLSNLINLGFGDDEIAYKTDMFSHYSAKIYNNNATEAFTMVVEKLADPQKFSENYLKDPDTFDFILGALTLPVSDIQKMTIDVASVVNAKNLSNDDFLYAKTIIKKIVFRYNRTIVDDFLNVASLGFDDSKILNDLPSFDRFVISSPMGRIYALIGGKNVRCEKDSRGGVGYYIVDITDGLSIKGNGDDVLNTSKSFCVQINNKYAAILVIALYEYFYKLSTKNINSYKIDKYEIGETVFNYDDIQIVAGGLGLR